MQNGKMACLLSLAALATLAGCAKETLSSSATMIMCSASSPLAKMAKRGVSGAASWALVTSVMKLILTERSAGGVSMSSRANASSEVIGG